MSSNQEEGRECIRCFWIHPSRRKFRSGKNGVASTMRRKEVENDRHNSAKLSYIWTEVARLKHSLGTASDQDAASMHGSPTSVGLM